MTNNKASISITNFHVPRLNDKLQQIYSEIDQLEKSKIEVKHFSKKNEQYFIFGLLGMCLLIAQAVLKYTLLRKIP